MGIENSSSKCQDILTLIIDSTSEKLSKKCTDIFYKKLRVYYIEKAINKQQITIFALQDKIPLITIIDELIYPIVLQKNQINGNYYRTVS